MTKSAPEAAIACVPPCLVVHVTNHRDRAQTIESSGPLTRTRQDNDVVPFNDKLWHQDHRHRPHRRSRERRFGLNKSGHMPGQEDRP